MLPAVVIWSVVSGLVALCAALALDFSLWVALLGYPIGGSIGLLGIALVANMTSGRAPGMTTANPVIDGLQER